MKYYQHGGKSVLFRFFVAKYAFSHFYGYASKIDGQLNVSNEHPFAMSMEH